MNSRSRKHLEQICLAADRIYDWTEDINEHRLRANKILCSAIERQFEVISAALSRIEHDDPDVLARIDDAQIAIRLGQAIYQKYDEIDYGILWRAKRDNLPNFLEQIRTIISHNKP